MRIWVTGQPRQLGPALGIIAASEARSGWMSHRLNASILGVERSKPIALCRLHGNTFAGLDGAFLPAGPKFYNSDRLPKYPHYLPKKLSIVNNDHKNRSPSGMSHSCPTSYSDFPRCSGAEQEVKNMHTTSPGARLKSSNVRATTGKMGYFRHRFRHHQVKARGASEWPQQAAPHIMNNDAI